MRSNPFFFLIKGATVILEFIICRRKKGPNKIIFDLLWTSQVVHWYGLRLIHTKKVKLKNIN